MNYVMYLVNLFFQIYILLILIRALISWVPHNRFNPVIMFIYEATDPILAPVRKGLPPNSLGIDASPIVAILLLWILNQVIISILYLI